MYHQYYVPADVAEGQPFIHILIAKKINPVAKVYQCHWAKTRFMLSYIRSTELQLFLYLVLPHLSLFSLNQPSMWLVTCERLGNISIIWVDLFIKPNTQMKILQTKSRFLINFVSLNCLGFLLELYRKSSNYFNKYACWNSETQIIFMIERTLLKF